MNSLVRAVRRYIPLAFGRTCPSCGEETMRRGEAAELPGLRGGVGWRRCRRCRWRGLAFFRRTLPPGGPGGDVPPEEWRRAAG